MTTLILEALRKKAGCVNCEVSVDGDYLYHAGVTVARHLIEDDKPEYVTGLIKAMVMDHTPEPGVPADLKAASPKRVRPK